MVRGGGGGGAAAAASLLHGVQVCQACPPGFTYVLGPLLKTRRGPASRACAIKLDSPHVELQV